jgi:hypothetical protein
MRNESVMGRIVGVVIPGGTQGLNRRIKKLEFYSFTSAKGDINRIV